MIHVIVVAKKKDSFDATDDSRETCGTQPVVQKTFIDRTAENRKIHGSFSKVKISSVEQPKIRAKVRASTKLGT